MDDFIARLLGLPEWAPRQMRRAAVMILAGTLVLSPATFEAGVEKFVRIEQVKMMRQMQPLLDGLLTPLPDTASEPTPESMSESDPKSGTLSSPMPTSSEWHERAESSDHDDR